MPSPITQKQFHAITRFIRESSQMNAYNAIDTANYFKISRSTVSTIRRAKTWNGFLAMKAARQTSPKTSPVEKELQTNLVELEKSPTREEFEKLQSSFGLLNRKVHYIARVPFIGGLIRKQLEEASSDHYRATAGK